MKNLLILFNLFFVFLITGCSQPEYVRLNKENLQKLDINKVTEVDLVSTSAGDEPKLWRPIYRNIFPISDVERIQSIYHCIKTGKSIDYAAPFKNLLFKTEDIVYVLSIRWDKKACYGDFWESADLLKNLESWGLTHPKGKPNLPSSKIKQKEPFEKPLSW